MPMVRKTYSFTEPHAEWIAAKVESGEYASESEVIRDLVRERVMTDAGREAFLRAARKGIESGPSGLTLEEGIEHIIAKRSPHRAAI